MRYATRTICGALPMSGYDNIDFEHTFTILDRPGGQMLLGSDFLKRHGAIIDYNKDTVKLGKRFQCGEIVERTPRARCAKDTTIPGHTIAHIPLYFEFTGKKWHIFNAVPSGEWADLIVPDAIDDVYHKARYAIVANPEAEDINIRRSTPIYNLSLIHI